MAAPDFKRAFPGPVRYNQLKEQIPSIRTKILTQRLREMGAGGLINREIFREIPPRIEYLLAEMGLNIFKILGELRRWGLEEDNRNNPKYPNCKSCLPFH